jgi:hypothetical protein
VRCAASTRASQGSPLFPLPQGNSLSGGIPAVWAQRALFGEPPLAMVVRPGNDRLCGRYGRHACARSAARQGVLYIYALYICAERGTPTVRRARSA